MNNYEEDVQTILNSERMRIAELERKLAAERARLDWIEQVVGCWEPGSITALLRDWVIQDVRYPAGLRAAIDEAMKEGL